jgi:hypothetical protein
VTGNRTPQARGEPPSGRRRDEHGRKRTIYRQTLTHSAAGAIDGADLTGREEEHVDVAEPSRRARASKLTVT